jgi:hypothetical protein
MGLDMYLTKKHYVKRWDFKSPEEQFEVVVTKGGLPVKGVNPEKISSVEEEVMYWRKANHIHYWFVKHCQNGEDNCKEHYVSSDDLLMLYETLKQVSEDHSRAEALLETASGFFFGGTEYDEYYFEEIDRTMKVLEEEMVDGEFKDDYYYTSSW